MHATHRATLALAALALAVGFDRLAPVTLDGGLTLLCRAIEAVLVVAAAPPAPACTGSP